MAEVNLKDRAIFDFIREGRPRPAALAGLMYENGYYDPANRDAIFAVIAKSDPGFVQQVVANLGGTVSGDTINFAGAPDGGFFEDWGDPVGLLGGAALAQFGGLSGLAKSAGLEVPSLPSWMQPTASAGGITDVPIEDIPWTGDQVAQNTYGAVSGYDPSVWDAIDARGGAATLTNQGIGSYGDFLKTLTPAAGAAAAAAGASGAGSGAASGAAGTAAAGAGAAAVGAGNGGIDDGALSQILNGGNSGPSAGFLKNLADVFGVTPENLTKLLGTGLSAGLGAYSSSQQADTLRELAREQQAAEKARYDDLVRRESERFMTLQQREDAAIARQQAALQDVLKREAERFETLTGREDAAIGRQQSQIAYDKGVVAPSQQRYESTFAPGFTMDSDPGYRDALDQTAKATTHALSVNGNPADSPNAWATTLKDLYEKTAYPALKDYRAANAATGYSGPFATGAATVPGIGTNLTQGITQNVPGIGTSLPGSTAVGTTTGSQVGFDTNAAGIGADGKVLNTIGSALGDVFNPKQSYSLADLMKLYQSGGNSIFKVAA